MRKKQAPARRDGLRRSPVISKPESPTVLVVGGGAVGCLYGGKLAQAGARVSTVSRSDYETVSRDGIHVASRPMEIEAIYGNAIRAARGRGVAVPHLETLYALLRLAQKKTGDNS